MKAINEQSKFWATFICVLALAAIGHGQSIDLTHQVITFKPDWANESLDCSTDLSFEILKPTNEIILDGRFLKITSIIQNGSNLKFKYQEEQENQNLNIDLGKKLIAGTKIDLTINYKTEWTNKTDPNNIWGSLGAGVRFFEPSTTEPGRQRQMWSVGEPMGNDLWFPGVHNTTDFRTTELFATVEKPLKVISNGNLSDEKDNGDGTKTFHWKSEAPYPSHLTSFVVGRFLSITQEYDGIDVISYCYPHEADATAATVERLPDMMRYFSEITGVKYPYPSYTQVFVQEIGGWQGNFQTSTITENMVDDWVTHKDFRWLWDIVESEALASQWFGGNISPKSWEDAWLSKAFLRHLSGLYNQYKNGQDEYLIYQYNPQISAYMTDWNIGNIQPVAKGDFDDATTFVRGNIPYMHGASVLHMLRLQLGDEAWFSILKTFSQNFNGKSASSEDFQKVVNQVSGKNMDWFFDQWVYGIGHPVFEIEKKWNSSRKELALHVKQLQRLDTLQSDFSSVEYFQGKMIIELDGEQVEIFIQPQESNTYTFNLSSKPEFTNFNFENEWVCEVREEKSFTEWSSQFLNSKDVLARITAMNQLGVIAGSETTSLEDKSRIYEEMRNVILSNETYWRLKMLALWQLQGLLVSIGELSVDEATEQMLITVIEREESWVKSSAVWFLGMTKDPKYADLYIDLFEDWSDRVTNAAAIALGKTKSEKAYDALMALKDKPSWKNQSLISALNGLQWLGDQRGVELALESLINNEAKHWTLSTPIWDHRLAASLTLNSLGAESKGFELINEQLKKAIEENDLNDVMYNALQLVNLADPRAKESFEMLKEHFASEPNSLQAIQNLEDQLMSSISK